jgi:hypothetical protein
MSATFIGYAIIFFRLMITLSVALIALRTNQPPKRFEAVLHTVTGWAGRAIPGTDSTPFTTNR